MHTLIFEQLMSTKMRKFTIIICGILMIFSTEKNLAQCPPNNFTSSDTICPLQNINIDNSLSTASSFNWDFCLGDLDSLPNGIALPSVSATLNYPQNMKLVEENGEFFIFLPNAGTNYITRYDFGNSLNNTPTVVNLNGDALLGTFASGMDLVKEGNKWYGFVTTYANQLIRLEFDSIKQINPIITNLNITSLANPNSIRVFEGYGFIPNNQTAEIIRLDFNGSYANIPSIIAPSINTGLFNNFSFDISFDCSSGKYIGYTSSLFSGGIISKVDFGNSLTNTPVFTNVLTALGFPLGLQLVEEKNNWHLFFIAGNTFNHYKIGESLDLTPLLDYSTNFGNILVTPTNLQLARQGSDWAGFVSNTNAWNVIKASFPQGCSGPALYSYDQNPNNINFPPSANESYQYFELTEKNNAGNTTNFIDSVYIHTPPPVAAFSSSSACKDAPTQFSDSSTICYGTINTWNWDFGDGNNSTLANPLHTYTTSGNFPVTLTVHTLSGDSATIQNMILVNDRPLAGFSVLDSACVGADVIFIDSSTSNAGIINQWAWNFGDNSGIGNTDTIAHSYATLGTYSIQLTVISDLGCADSITKNIKILPGPISEFQVFNTCAGEVAQFNNLTTTTGTSLLSTLWNFGDSNNSTTLSPSHAYPSGAAIYTVELISTAQNGCADTITRNIRIANQPLPWFTTDIDTACTFSTIQFTDSSFAGIGDTISKRIWDFGDGIKDSTSLNPIHIYSTAGLYTITLTIQSPDDCDSSIQRSVFVIESPTANFTVTNVCLGSNSNFIDLSTSPSGSLLTEWSWAFGDTNTSTSQNPSNNYPDTGSYDVTLIVKSDIGCYDTLTATTQVYSLPIAWFTHPSACTGSPVQFTDSSTVTGSSITGWSWDFGSNGGTSNLSNPNFTYNDPLAFPVTLIATSAQGCLDTITRILIANQSPDFSITTTDHCFGTNQPFVSTPAPGSNSNYSYLWNFGDSTASFLPLPFHNYSSSGTFSVNLLVTDLINSCSSLLADTLTVHSLPRAGFSNTLICVGTAVQFNDTSVSSDGTIASYTWNLGTAGNSTQQNPTALFNSFGTQNIQLSIQTSFGCKDSITKSVTVNSLPIISIAASPNYGAPPLNVQYANTSSTGTYNWSFGDGSLNSTLSVPTHVFNDTGIYHSTLIVTNAAGCIDSSSVTIYVQIPERDLSINGVSFNKVNNKWVMKAIVANLGNEDAIEFELKANLSGEQQFYNTFKFDTLKAGTFKEYTFNTTLDAGSSTPPFFCVEVISVNSLEDMNSSNDRFCRSSSNSFEIFNVYPNPFKDQLYLGVNMIKNGEIIIEIFDLHGKSCMNEYSINIPEGLNTIVVPTDALSSSAYMMKVTYNGNEKSIKILKQ
jgi:PKD repeat protein